MVSRYKGVIFDLDGVLVSTDECHYRAWKQLADQQGIPFTRKDNERLRGVSRMESLEILLEKAARTYTDAEKQKMAEEKNMVYRCLLQDLTPADLLPGAVQLLEMLRGQGLKLAVGSSSKNTPLILEKVGMSDAFDAVADGNQIHHSKPDPEVFLLAARLLEIAPEECIVVEDAAAGISAAAAAGAKPVAVGSAQGCAGAAYSVADLTAVDLELFLC